MKRLIFTSLAVGALVLAAAPATMAQGGGDDEVTVMVMKHICDPAQVKNLDDFNAIIDGAESPVAALVGTVLACPAAVNPGDDTSNGIKSDATDFSFTVEDANGTHPMSNNSMAAKLCESDVELDANGDGTISGDVCLDISHYVFEGVANGDVTVTESDRPAGFHFGEQLFTPTQIDNNNDADSRVSIDRDAGVIELDTTADEDGMIMLHVYNFQDEMPDSAAAAEAVNASPSYLGGLAAGAAGVVAFAVLFIVGLRRREPSAN